MGVQGQDFRRELLGPDPKPSKGLRKANLTPRTKALLEEVALSEQVRLRQPRFSAGGLPLCTPAVLRQGLHPGTKLWSQQQLQTQPSADLLSMPARLRPTA